MAFDGITIANITHDLNKSVLNGRISKIAQPEKDELILTIKGNSGQARIVMSASASLPLIYFTQTNKPSPITAPNFCMLLRKHIANGRITRIYQPDMERLICFEIEHLNELGDLRHKKLIIEIMGKHSNIIFIDDDDTIIDSIKHVSANMSSVREVLPGRKYFIPKTIEKTNPLLADKETFFNSVFSKPMKISKAIYSSFTGISPVIAEEIMFRSGLSSDTYKDELNDDMKLHIFNIFTNVLNYVRDNNYSPCIIYDDKNPVEFASIALKMYSDMECVDYDNISVVLNEYYSSKEIITRIRQKSVDLRKITGTALDRCRKKYALQMKQLKDTEKRDKYKVYGELINTYGYNVASGAKSFEALNYYTNKMITIPLDPTLTPQENAIKYFDRYNKLKRTFEALSKMTESTKDDILHLQTISTSLDIAQTEDDLVQIKEELVEYSYINKKTSSNKKKVKIKSKPFHYISSDGFHMYVGKNNFQNDELTFKFANGGDWWFHAKGIPGSHVIVKTEGEELPDNTFEEAGRLAAYYSAARDTQKVDIDYLMRKNVKKPNGSKPGFVVYYTNFSLTIEPDISNIKEVKL